MKYIITESQKSKLLRKSISDYGFIFTSNMVGGVDDLFKLIDITNPISFLHLFDNLEGVRSKKYPDLILLKNKSKRNIMVYNSKKETLYINDTEVWSILKNYFGLTYKGIQALAMGWLSDVYNLKDIEVHSGSDEYMDLII